MKLFSLFFAMVLALGVIVALLLFLGANQGSRQAEGALRYDLATELKTTGMVQEVQEFRCPLSGAEVGTHLVLKTKKGTMTVHLAPSRFMRNQKFSFAKGNEIEVLGSRIRYEGTDALIARSITRGNETFVFRDPNGKPLWVE